MLSEIRVGWSQRDITPTGPVTLRGQFNLRLATRIQDPLTLTALALDNGADHAVIVSMDLCGVDHQVFDGARAALAERLPEVDPRKLIVSATHTHTAPFAGGDGWQQDADYLAPLRARHPDYMTIAEYTTLLTTALVEATCEAWARRTKGHVGWGYSHAVVGENRRVRYFDDSARMYGSVSVPEFSHIEGHVDHSVNLLFTYDTDRQLTGTLINLACPSQASESGQDFVSADYWHDVREELRRRHGRDLFVLPQCSAAGDQSPHRLIAKAAEDRMLQLKYGSGVGRPLINLACPSQASESGQDFVSADYWHDVREELRRRHGRDLFVLPQCSAAGDQSPHRLIAKAAEDRMLQLKYGSGVGRPLNAALRTEISRRLANAVDDAEPAVRQDLRDEAILTHENRVLDLEHWQVTEAEYATLQEQLAEARQRLEQLGDSDPLSGEYTSLRSHILWYQGAIHRHEHPVATVPTGINVLRVGDIAFVTAPFEYYLDYGDRIKGRSPALQTFVVQLTAGGSYLATERAAQGLSYGAVPASCEVSPAGGQQLVEAAVGVLEEMFATE